MNTQLLSENKMRWRFEMWKSSFSHNESSNRLFGTVHHCPRVHDAIHLRGNFFDTENRQLRKYSQRALFWIIYVYGEITFELDKAADGIKQRFQASPQCHTSLPLVCLVQHTQFLGTVIAEVVQ